MLGSFEDFQLIAHDVSYSCDTDLQSRAWVLEMDGRVSSILEMCHLKARLTIVPFMDPSAWDNNGAAETFFIKHNLMLRNTQIINVNGLTGLENVTEDNQKKTITVREAFHSHKYPHSHNTFTNVSQVNSKRIYFRTTQDKYRSAVKVIEDFLATFIPKFEASEHPKYLSNDKNPIRVGKGSIPTLISTTTMRNYTEHLKDFSHDLDDEIKSSLSLPLNRRNCGQPSYLEATKVVQECIVNLWITLPQPPRRPPQNSASQPLGASTWTTEFEAKLQQAVNHLTA